MIKKITSLVFLFSLLALASAETCLFDATCPEGKFCDEWNTTTEGFAQCSEIEKIQCNGTNISCSSNSDCAGIGNEICVQSAGICTLNADIGEPCQLDYDCKSGAYCVLGVCTKAGGNYICSSDADCEYGKTCVNGFCRSWGRLGAYCVNNWDCMSMVCDDIYNVCSECEYSWGWDGDGHIASDSFCNLNHYSSCSLLNPYADYALQNSYPVVTLEKRRGEGDSCDNSACCLSNNCQNGVCVGSVSGEIGGYSNINITGDICSLDYTISPSTYLDGQDVGSPSTPYYEDIAVNITNINILANRTYNDLRPIRGSWARLTPFWARWHSLSNPQATGTPYNTIMSLIAYSNSTGDLCYFHQYDYQIVVKCFESCLSPGLASGVWTTGGANSHLIGSVNLTTYPTFSCISDDETLLIQGRTLHLPLAYGIWVFTDFQSTKASTMAIYKTDLADIGFSYYTNNWVFHKVVSTSSRTVILRYDTVCDHDPEGYPCYETFSGATKIKGSIELGSSTYHTTPYDSYIDEVTLADAFCCTGDTSCVERYGDGWCCNTDQYSCYPCYTGQKRIEISYSSIPDSLVSTKKACSNSTYTIYVNLLDNGNEIHPSGTISASVLGGGSIIPNSCDSSKTPCVFSYTARDSDGTDKITFSYSGNNNYDAVVSQLGIDVSEDCKWVDFLVYKHEDYFATPRIYTPIYGVRVTADNGDEAITLPLFLFGRFVASASFEGLPDEDRIFTFSKDGYETETINLTKENLDKFWIITLKAETEEYMTSWGLYNITPENTPDAVRGMKEVALGMTGVSMNWIFPLLLLFFLFAIILGLFKSVT